MLQLQLLFIAITGVIVFHIDTELSQLTFVYSRRCACKSHGIFSLRLYIYSHLTIRLPTVLGVGFIPMYIFSCHIFPSCNTFTAVQIQHLVKLHAVWQL